jgi:tRNA (guanine37-N1)-methyltransferase
MVMLPDPVFGALNAVEAQGKRILYMSPRGRILDQTVIGELFREESMVILCGHYEGVDQRIIDYWNMEEISVGDYILTGGELPAMILIDAVARMIPAVLGNSAAHNEESIYSGLLEYPQYTKPRRYESMDVPEVLISGHHKLIHLWQFEQSLTLTRERRKDLWTEFLKREDQLTKDERKILRKLMAKER